jgi:hypothetical protein
MSKFLYIFAIVVLLSSCQITENLTINEDGSGTIEMSEFRYEPSYMQVMGEQYGKEDFYKDKTYVFKDYIDKYSNNFIRYTPTEQVLFSMYNNVGVHIMKSSFDKEYKTTFNYSFDKVSTVPDLYKTEDYADDLENNYALTAEKHYYKIRYAYDNFKFNRIVTITNLGEQNRQKAEMEAAKSKYGKLGLIQTYQLNYNFPRKIKSVSNNAATISADKKSMTISFPLNECIANPEITQLEVVLE